MLPDLIPPDIQPMFALVLVFSSFFTSALTAAMGLGGGVAMLAIMGMGMPVSSLVPVHGIVQLGSNAGRAVIQRRHVSWSLVFWFLAGSVIGVSMGGAAVAAVPEWVARLLLALFILWSVFGSKPRLDRKGEKMLLPGGLLTSFATMLVGATGPLVAALLSTQGLVRQSLIATHAVCLVIQHGLKILVFGLLGFAYGDWLVLLAAMIATGVAGSYVGSRILDRLPEKGFRVGFRITMGILGMQMLYEAWRQFSA